VLGKVSFGSCRPSLTWGGENTQLNCSGENGKCYAGWDPSSHFSPSLSLAFSSPYATLILFTFRSKTVVSNGQDSRPTPHFVIMFVVKGEGKVVPVL